MDKSIHFDTPIEAGPEVEYFANALDDALDQYCTPYEKRSRILKLLETYHTYSLQRCSASRKQQRGRPRRSLSGSSGCADMELDDLDESPLYESPHELLRWRQEAQTWDLLRRLLPLQFPERQSPSNQTKHTKMRGKNIWRDFVESDDSVIERRAVLQWLQTNAESGPAIDDVVQHLQDNADRGDIISHGWIHTRSAIKLRKSVSGTTGPINPPSSHSTDQHLDSTKLTVVTQLDPDSATRQGKNLEPQDEYFERAIWRGCYELLRRGYDVEAIRRWCLDRTEAWRAVSMFGLVFPRQESSEPITDFSPEALTLWRRACLAVAKQGPGDDYKRAVYGILGGDISSVETVCETWEDFLFTHYNAALRCHFDTFALTQCPPEAAATLSQTFSAFDSSRYNGDRQSVEERLFKTLESYDMTKRETREPLKALQASILLKDLESHLFDQGRVLGNEAEKGTDYKLLVSHGLSAGLERERFFGFHDYHGLRIVSHIFIIISQLKATAGGEAKLVDENQRRIQENLIAAYTNFLRLSNLYEMIPLYCSMLTGPRRYTALSRNLIRLTGRESQVVALSLMRKAGLDVLEFAKMQPTLQLEALGLPTAEGSVTVGFEIVTNQLSSHKYGRLLKTDFFGDDPDRIELTHELLIRSMEWLLLVDNAWPYVFSFGVVIYEYFLRNGHLNAARSLAKRVSFAEVSQVSSLVSNSDDTVEQDLDDVTFWESRLPAYNLSQSSASRIAADSKVFRDFESLVKVLDTMETVASLIVLSQEDAGAKREFWTKVGSEIRDVKQYMKPILGSWLLPMENEDDKKYAALRQTYVPETTLAYISILHFAGAWLSRDNFLECMELAAAIADRGSNVATTFISTKRMRELVEAFASSSKALAIVSGEKRYFVGLILETPPFPHEETIPSFSFLLLGHMEGQRPVLPPKPRNNGGPAVGSVVGAPYNHISGKEPGRTPSSLAVEPGRHALLPPQAFDLCEDEPGDTWLPESLLSLSTQDLALALADAKVLTGLIHSPETIHPSVSSSNHMLLSALDENIEMASQLIDLESKVAAERVTTQAQLLSTHALERQWKQKQIELDHVLAPFSPASLYQRLSQGVQEQDMVCHALQESFLEGMNNDPLASEREVMDWVKRYREARILYHLRYVRKERWDEGRVGGWR